MGITTAAAAIITFRATFTELPVTNPPVKYTMSAMSHPTFMTINTTLIRFEAANRSALILPIIGIEPAAAAVPTLIAVVAEFPITLCISNCRWNGNQSEQER